MCCPGRLDQLGVLQNGSPSLLQSCRDGATTLEFALRRWPDGLNKPRRPHAKWTSSCRPTLWWAVAHLVNSFFRQLVKQEPAHRATSSYQAGRSHKDKGKFNLSVCLSASLKTNLFCVTSSILDLVNIKNRSNSARHPQFLTLTMSKRKQFCDTSSIFQVDNRKNKAILRDFLQKWKVESTGDGLVPMRFAIFPLHLFKLLRLPGKSDARSYEVLYLSPKIILANLKISCSKMQPFSRNIRPDLLTHLTNVSLVLRLPREMHLCRSSSNVPRLPSFWNCYKTLTFCYRLSTVSRW